MSEHIYGSGLPPTHRAHDPTVCLSCVHFSCSDAMALDDHRLDESDQHGRGDFPHVPSAIYALVNGLAQRFCDHAKIGL